MGKRFIRIIKYILQCTLEVIYPHFDSCISCGETIEEEHVCKNCLNNISYINGEYYLDKDKKIRCFSAAYYSGTIKEIIIKLKYSANFESAEFLSKILFDKISRENICGDIITYVPTSKVSIKKRGYNQCRVLGKELANLSGIRLVDTLKRLKEVKEQKRLAVDERLANMDGVFQVVEPSEVVGKNVILIDDVLTTGATVMSCRDALIKCGANNVILLTVAKSNI
ncbi:phosphoribosyltransferase family protein [Clostridium sp. C8-1-8]|uniref:ComF family protein n=1 Tax=Clostridium sp. C8-1-8 TaxID=2698831 RepID=UPI00136DCC71|nr:phosphoribosyltransferase family protein [Clostridium sp. C8-1-8]